MFFHSVPYYACNAFGKTERTMLKMFRNIILTQKCVRFVRLFGFVAKNEEIPSRSGGISLLNSAEFIRWPRELEHLSQSQTREQSRATS